MAPPPPDRILVVCTRRLGDVLLATPMIRSLKQAWPEAAIDALVFAPTAAALTGNPDLRRIIAWPQKAGLLETWRLARPLFRHYALAVAMTASDRAHYTAAWAARRRAAVVLPEHGKRWLLQTRVTTEPSHRHIVVQALRLAEKLGIAPVPELVPPQPADTRALDGLLGAGWAARPTAVVHAAPMFAYKAWTLEGWRALIRWLAAQGLRVVLSGGPAAAERAYIADILAGLDSGADAPCNLAGQLEFAALTPLLTRARVFIGPDTSVTHLAAACGTPTVALFGPSTPVAWGPWPQGWTGSGESPWVLRAPVQRSGNVLIVQGTTARVPGCIPCTFEGCERHIGSRSDCLDGLSAARVIAAVAQMLGAAAPP